jgi:hypothetical protein
MYSSNRPVFWSATLEEERKTRPFGTAAHPLPAMRLDASQRRQLVLHLRM